MQGHRVKLTVQFPGIRAQKAAYAMMDKLVDSVKDSATVVPPKPTEKRVRNTFSVLLLPVN